jgi:uncharacterized protein YkwD
MHTAAHADKRSRCLRILVNLVAVLALGAAQSDVAARQQNPQPAIAPTDLAKRIHAQINERRVKHSLRTLRWNDSLSRIALKHSRDMANRNYLGHDTPEGISFSDRYRQAGYSCEIRIGNQVHAGAENLALGRLYNSMSTRNGVADYHWNSVQQIALNTVDGWMNSPGHRENILAPHWRQEGIGIEIGPGNRIYITQNFC